MKFFAATIVLLLLAFSVSMLVSLLIGAAASLVSDEPGMEKVTNELGHRAIAWTCALCGAGLLALFTIEQWWPKWLPA